MRTTSPTAAQVEENEPTEADGPAAERMEATTPDDEGAAEDKMAIVSEYEQDNEGEREAQDEDEQNEAEQELPASQDEQAAALSTSTGSANQHLPPATPSLFANPTSPPLCRPSHRPRANGPPVMQAVRPASAAGRGTGDVDRWYDAEIGRRTQRTSYTALTSTTLPPRIPFLHPAPSNSNRSAPNSTTALLTHHTASRHRLDPPQARQHSSSLLSQDKTKNPYFSPV